jgi:hypothetical protein
MSEVISTATEAVDTHSRDDITREIGELIDSIVINFGKVFMRTKNGVSGDFYVAAYDRDHLLLRRSQWKVRHHSIGH